jgi:hypothetical protein
VYSLAAEKGGQNAGEDRPKMEMRPSPKTALFDLLNIIAISVKVKGVDIASRAFNIRDKRRHLFENVLVLKLFSAYAFTKVPQRTYLDENMMQRLGILNE